MYCQSILLDYRTNSTNTMKNIYIGAYSTLKKESAITKNWNRQTIEGFSLFIVWQTLIWPGWSLSSLIDCLCSLVYCGKCQMLLSFGLSTITCRRGVCVLVCLKLKLGNYLLKARNNVIYVWKLVIKSTV